MKTIKIGAIIAAIIFMIVEIASIDYNNLTWSTNKGPFFGIIAMICVIVGASMSFRNDLKSK